MSNPPIDPLADYTPDWREKKRQPIAPGQQQGSDPLAAYTPNWRELDRTTGLSDQRLTTAVGRREVASEDLAIQTAKYEELLKRPNLTATQRSRLERFIEKNKQGNWTRRSTGEHNGAEDFIRGVAAGIPKASVGLGDLAGAVTEVATLGNFGQGIRDAAKEASAFYDETLDPQGKAGLAGDVVGNLAGGIPGYGMISGATAKGLLKILPEAGKAAAIIRAAQAGSIGQRVVGQAMVNVPLDAFQAATMEDASIQDKIKQFAISSGAGALFALLPPSAKARAEYEAGQKYRELVNAVANPKEVNVTPESAAALAATGQGPNETTQAALTAAAEEAARKRAARELQDAAKLQWKKENPGESWKELTDVEKKQYIIQYRAAQKKVEVSAAPEPEPTVPAQPVEVPPPPGEPMPAEQLAPVQPQEQKVNAVQAEVANTEVVLEEPKPIDPIQAKLDELKARMDQGYTGLPDIQSVQEPPSTAPRNMSEVQTLVKHFNDTVPSVNATPELVSTALQGTTKDVADALIASSHDIDDAISRAGILSADVSKVSTVAHEKFRAAHSYLLGLAGRESDHYFLWPYTRVLPTDLSTQVSAMLDGANELGGPAYAAHVADAIGFGDGVPYIPPELASHGVSSIYKDQVAAFAKYANDPSIHADLSTPEGLKQRAATLEAMAKEPVLRRGSGNVAYALEKVARELKNQARKLPASPTTATALVSDTPAYKDVVEPPKASLPADVGAVQEHVEDLRAIAPDEPTPVISHPDPAPPTEQVAMKLNKPKKLKDFQAPARNKHGDIADYTGAIGYESTVLLPGGKLQPVEIFNYMASISNAKEKGYMWRFKGEGYTDWRYGGSNFKDIENAIKQHINAHDAPNPMTLEQMQIVQQQIAAGRKPKIPLEKMTLNQLTKHIDKLNDLVDKLPPEKVDGPEHQVLENEIRKAAKQKATLAKEIAAQPSIAEAVGKEATKQLNELNGRLADIRNRMDISSNPEELKQLQTEYLTLQKEREVILSGAKDAGASVKEEGNTVVNAPTKEAPPPIDVNTISPETRARWFMSPVDELPPRALEAHAQDLVEKINSLPKDKKAPYIKRFNEVKERYVRLSKMKKDGFMTVNTPPEVVTSLLGFMIGAGTGETDEERARNAFYGLMIGAGGGYALRRMHFKYSTTKANPLLVGEAEIKKYVRTAAEQEGLQKFQPFLSRLESWYQKIARPSFAIEKVTEMAGGKRLPAQLNPGKLAAMFGRWVSQTEDFIFGKPSMEDADGNSIILKDVRSVVEIANMVDGDTETLGNLMAARATIEQHKSGGRITSPIPLADALTFAGAAPQKFHDAADEARKVSLALVDILVDAGIVSPTDRVKMATQLWYAPLERIFGNAPKPTNAPLPIGASGGSGLPATNPIKGKGQGVSPHLIANPFETMVGNIPRMLRAAERNKAKVALVNLYRANKDAFEGLMAPAPRSKKANTAAFNAQVTAVKAQLGVSTQQATAMASAFGDMHLDPTSNTMSVWNEGVLETYRLDPYVAEAYRSLHPEELDLMWSMLGIPASVARRGIVSNPVFLLYQAFRDNWQATMNSQYHFRFGIDWIKGWAESMKNSPEYKQYIARGGGNSLYAQREILSASKTLKAIETKGVTAEGPVMGVVVKQLKQMEFLEAYHTIMTPIAEAARVGEYLRARGHGASAMEAVYAAKEVTGNYGQVAPLIKGLNRATLFLNPAIKAMDQAFYASGAHPFRTPDVGKRAAAARYGIKAFLTLVLPSIAVKLHQEKVKDGGDDSLVNLQRSEFGRRYWFIKTPQGSTIKLPKPQFEGQIFGTSVEVAIDAWKEKNPEEFFRWKDAVVNDAAMNLLPVVAAVPYSMVAGKDLDTGINITPYGTEKLDPEKQYDERTSVAARVVGRALGPLSGKIENETWRRALSPAGLDYITKSLGGTLAREFTHSLDVAVNWNAKGYLAPAVELPIIRGMLVDYPTNSVQPIQEFYRVAEIVDRKAKTFQNIVETEPTRASEYFMDNKEWIRLSEMYAKARQEIADMRQAYEDIANMPGDKVSPVYRRELKQKITANVIRITSLVNQTRLKMRQ